jgi:hypothetical protein
MPMWKVRSKNTKSVITVTMATLNLQPGKNSQNAKSEIAKIIDKSRPITSIVQHPDGNRDVVYHIASLYKQKLGKMLICIYN